MDFLQEFAGDFDIAIEELKRYGEQLLAEDKYEEYQNLVNWSAATMPAPRLLRIKAITIKAAADESVTEEQSPSTPSVKFTAFVAPYMRTIPKRKKNTLLFIFSLLI